MRAAARKRILLCLTAFLLVGGSCFGKPTEEELRVALEEDPTDEWALYNLGLARYLAQDFEEAATLLGRLTDQDPNDWEAREKLIQALSGLGDEERVDVQIALLRKDFESGDFEKLAERGFFIRDQFTIDQVRVFVIEYFELTGERPLLWRFMLDSGGVDLDYWISLGSYPGTNEALRRNGDIGPDERGYHLDGYWKDGSHALYRFFRGKPPYPDVRDLVIEILNETLAPVSSSIPVSEEEAAEEKE